MFKYRLRFVTPLCLALVFAACLSGTPVRAQGPTSVDPLYAPVADYLSATGQVGTQTYLNNISASPQNAWNGGVNTFDVPPQLIGGIIPNGTGQVNLPGGGGGTPTGSYQQTLTIPNGVPVIGGWNTGIQTTVKTYVNSQGGRTEAPVDPVSTFNYAMTHPTPGSYQGTGLANTASFLGSWLNGSSASGDGSDSAFRLDPGLVIALNSNYGQGAGIFTGVSAYYYPADTPTGVASAVPPADAGSVPGVPDVPPGVPPGVPGIPPGVPPDVPPAPQPLPSGGEQVYLKAVIPPAPPDFTLAFQPPFPVVVGQDPTQRGVDVTGHATLNPCTVIWHHVLHEYYYYCGPNVPTCNGSSPNVEVRESTREWDTTEREPDALASAAVDAVLSPASVNYLQTTLAQRYPGAHVYQGQVRVYPSAWAQVTQNYVGIPSGWEFQALRVPFADPGQWDFHAALTTTGTPHCSPLNWGKDFPGVLTVWLREQRLTK